jgi:hypothetical protein
MAMMSRGARPALFMACGALSLGLLSLSPEPPSSYARGTAGWCGNEHGDWVCPRRGEVFAEGRPLRAKHGRKVKAETRVSTAKHSLARLNLSEQAHCFLGGGPASILYTRTGLGGALFTQSAGRSLCEVSDKSKPVRILCDLSEECPTELNINGELLTDIPESAAEISTSGGWSVLDIVTRLELCDGSFRVRVKEDSGYHEAAGAADRFTHFVVLIIEHFRTAESEGVIVEDEHSTKLRVIGKKPGGSRCLSRSGSGLGSAESWHYPDPPAQPAPAYETPRLAAALLPAPLR